MQRLEKAILEDFGIKVFSINNYRDGYLINTDVGKKMVKSVIFSPERILFVHGAKERLIENGFSRIDRYLCNLNNQPFMQIDNSFFVVSDYIEGRECNLNNDEDVSKAAALMASMHQCSSGYKPPEGCIIQDDLGNLPQYFTKRLEDIKKLRKRARKGNSKFDLMFLEHIDFYISLAEDAIKRLLESDYFELSEECRQEGRFCHHDYTHYNIILDDEDASLINFEYCCFELKVYDLANFIRRRMRKYDWDIEKVKVIIDSYTAVEKISPSEQLVMELILQYPQKFWRVVNRYYNSRRSWSEHSFVARMQEVIDEIAPHSRFMEQYGTLWR